jgi:hypothetical protein
MNNLLYTAKIKVLGEILTLIAPRLHSLFRSVSEESRSSQ